MTSLFKITSVKITPFKIGLVMLAAFLGCWYSFHDQKPDLFTVLDNRIYDQMFKFRGPVPTSGEIIIVDIDEKSLKKYGQFPWPRDLLAALLKNINAAPALVTGIDIVFAERDRTTPAVSFEKYRPYFKKSGYEFIAQKLVRDESMDHDLVLGEEISKGNTVSGYSFILEDDGLKTEQEAPFPSIQIGINPQSLDYKDLTFLNCYRAVINIPELATAVSEGFFNVFPDPSGTVRKVPLFIAMDNIPYPSLAFEMYRLGKKRDKAILHASTISRDEKKRLLGIHLGMDFILTDYQAQIAVNFRGPVYSFPYISAADIMENKSMEKIKGKHVLIGTSAAGLFDTVATPFAPIFPGVEVHATIIDNLIQKDFMVNAKYTEIGFAYVMILAAGLLIITALVVLGPLTGSTLALLLILSIVIGDYYFYFLNMQLVGISYILVTLICVVLVVTIFNYFYEGRQKKYIRKAFSHYLAPSVINELIKNPQFLELRVEKKEITIFFSDIRGFTDLSERIGEQKLGGFMNQYFSVISRIIMKHKGMVDKYIGDAVMAVWGTPVDDPDHAINAIHAAMEIKQELAHFNKNWTHLGIEAKTGIGINTGDVVVGNFGSTDRFDYTVLGDHVNLASRLEGLNKTYETDIIISEFTLALFKTELFCQYIDTVRVKGKTKPVKIYHPLCQGLPDSALEKENTVFEKGIALYMKKEFVKAELIFKQLYDQTATGLYLLYAQRCRQFMQSPPDDDWDGVFTHTKK
ncbi:MAG: adenylate/guanylate cyclase domain-containing protein [Desulfobacteraceae bacterium]|nr:adenylate/guanylate cyclase domain-containing protein [Desulfobacteraceae bacterium]